MEIDHDRSSLASFFSTTLFRTLINLAPFILLFFFLLIQHQHISFNGLDDTYIGQVHTRLSLVDYLVLLYKTWSGRISTDATAYIVLQLPVVMWRWINTLVITTLCFLFARFLLGKRFWDGAIHQNGLTLWGLCAGIGLINIQILQNGMFWPTGTVYYLWPLTACALALIPFYDRWAEAAPQKTVRETAGETAGETPGRTPRSLVLAIFPLLAVLFAALGNEQICFIFLSLAILTNLALWVFKKTYDPYLLALTVVGILCGILTFTAPGNYARFQAEAARWYPAFPQMSLKLKVFLGLSWMLDGVINLNRVMVILLFALLAVNLWQNRQNRSEAVLAGIAAFVAAFLVIALVNLGNQPRGFQTWIDDRFFNFGLLAKYVQGEALPQRIDRWQLALFPYVFWLSLIAALPLFFMRCCKNALLNGWVYGMLFFIGLATMMAISFSPTIYASGNRTMFPFSMLLLFILGGLFQPVAARIPWPIVWAIYLFAVLALVVNPLDI